MNRKLEWPQNVVKLPVQDEADQERIRQQVAEQAKTFKQQNQR